MHRNIGFCVRYAACLAALVGPSVRARCDDPYYRLSSFASGNGNLIYLSAGVGLPLIEDGRKGQQIALRVGDAYLTSTLIAEGLKKLSISRRPNGEARDSFPSAHATAAFAVATAESQYHPRQAPLWYAGAALISASRVRLGEHQWHEVLAGAALGYLTARWEISRPHGLLLSPWVRPRGRGTGVSIFATF